MTTAPCSLEYPTRSIFLNFVIRGYITDVIIDIKFYVNRFMVGEFCIILCVSAVRLLSTDPFVTNFVTSTAADGVSPMLLRL